MDFFYLKCSMVCNIIIFTKGIFLENLMEVPLIKSHFLQRFKIYSVVRYLRILASNSHFDISTGLADLTDESYHRFSLFSEDTLSLCSSVCCQVLFLFCPDNTNQI